MDSFLNKIDGLINKGLGTRKELATYLGMTPQGVGRIIKSNSTKSSTLKRIADYFKVVPAFFLDKEMSYEQAQVEKQINNITLQEEVNALKNEINDIKGMLLKLHSRLLDE